MYDSSQKYEDKLEKIIKSKFTEYEVGTICGIACGSGIKRPELDNIFIDSKDMVDALIHIIAILNNRRKRFF